MIRWTLHGHTLIPVCYLVAMSMLPLISGSSHETHLVIMNMVIGPNRVDAIEGSKIASPNGQVKHLDVQSEIKNEVELGTVDKNEVMNRCIDGRYQSQ